MRLLGWTLAAGLMLTAVGESKAQIVIGNPYTGGGVAIGAGGVSISNGLGYPYGSGGYGYNGYGFNPYGYGTAGYGSTYGLPMTGVYSSGYVAPGYVSSYGVGGLGMGGYRSYSATSYVTPYYGVRSYGYGYPRYYGRGLFGRRYGW